MGNDGNIKRYDLEDIELTAGDPMVMAFVEYIPFGTTTVRFDVRNTGLSAEDERRMVVVLGASGGARLCDPQAGTGDPRVC